MGDAEHRPALLHRLSSRHHLLSAVLLVVCFLPLLWIARYNYPSGDDHIILLKAQRLGSWGATVDWYTGWTGRYATFFILSVLGRYTDWFVSYRLIPVVLLFAGFACSYAFLRALTRARLETKTQFSLAACFYVVLISLTPDITTAFYWSGSNVMYAGGVFASVLAVALYMRAAEESRRGKRWALIAGVAVLNAAVAGFNELSLLLLAAAIWWNNLLHFRRRRKVEVEGLVALASIALFGAVSLLAPGNAVRAARVGAKIDVAASLFGSVALPVYLVFELMATTALLPATILYVAFLEAQRPRLEPALTRWTEPRWPWIALLMVGTIGAVTVPLFATVGVTSLVDRLKNVYVLSICFGWLFLTTAVVADLWRRRMALAVPRWVLATLAVYVLCFLVTGFELKVDRSRAATAAEAVQVGFALVDTRSVYADAYLDLLSGRAERYAAVNAVRERRLRESGADAVEIPLHSYVPETIFVQDVNHRWGVPDAMSEVFCGRVKPLRYIETGPPAPPKRKF